MTINLNFCTASWQRMGWTKNDEQKFPGRNRKLSSLSKLRQTSDIYIDKSKLADKYYVKCICSTFHAPSYNYETKLLSDSWVDVHSVAKLLNRCEMFLGFNARRSYASAGLGVIILSVCPSVCHKRALWLIQRIDRRYFYTTRKGNPSSFLAPKISAKFQRGHPTGAPKRSGVG